MKLRSVVPMRAAKSGYIIISAVLCILGAVLIAVPDFSASLLGVICGIILILFGAVRLTGYFSKDLYRLAFQYDLTFGILLITLGTAMLLNPESLITFICIALGISVLSDGLFKIEIALEAKRFGVGKWWLILSFAILTGIFGAVLMLRPGEGSSLLMTLLGFTLIFEGVLNFSTVITAVKIVKHQKPDVIEVNYYEESED